MIFTAIIAVALAGPESSLAANLINFEAESGVLGSDFAVSNSSSPAYIIILSDSVASIPGSAARVASYTVTFPSAGTYQLYARVLVGPNGYNDDSMFYASSFGVKSPALNSDWVLVNGLAGVGYTATNDIVNGAGTAGYPVWKWINLSEFAGNVSFTVSTGRLTQTFQIGARENGLDMDKFAFVTAGTTFTVANLDNGVSNGSPTNKFTGPDGIAFHRFSPLVNGINADGANPATALVLSDGVLLGTTLNGGSQGAGTAFYMTSGRHKFQRLPFFCKYAGRRQSGGRPGSLGQQFFWNEPGRRKPGRGHGFFGEYQRQLFPSCRILPPSRRMKPRIPAEPVRRAAGFVRQHAFWNHHRRRRGGQWHGVFVVHEWFGFFSPARFQRAGLQHRHQCRRRASVRRFDFVWQHALWNRFRRWIRRRGRSLFRQCEWQQFHHAPQLHAIGPAGGHQRRRRISRERFALSNGMLYGTTYAGGCGGRGTVFSIQTNGVDFVVLHNFSATDPVTGTNSDGASPCAALALSGSNLYGTAAAGGAGAAGTVFSVSTNGMQFQTIHAFPAVDSSTGTNFDGALPVAGVLPVGNSLYGTTFSGGPGGVGTVFNLTIPYPPAVITGIAPIRTAVQRCISSAAPIPPTSFKPPPV